MMPTSTSSSPPRRSIPPLVLLSFAVLHSQVYWLYSIIYHLCNNLSDRPMDLSLDDTVLQALTRRSGRARAFSEPQQTSCIMLQQRQTLSKPITRPRSTTISATTVDADAPLQRQQWVQQFHACVDEQQRQKQQQQQQLLLDATAIADERLGRTRPPRWWQRTRRHLSRHDTTEPTTNRSSQHPITSTFSLPPSIEFVKNHQDHPFPPCGGDMQPGSHHHHHDISNCIDDEDAFDLAADHATRHRPLAKIRSVLIKSQIEPEHNNNNKRKSILGIPSRWSTTLHPQTKTSPPPPPPHAGGRSKATMTLPPSESKRRLFSSLPAWKRKSVA